MGHTREDLELEVGHWLECNLEGKCGGRAVDLGVLGAEIPKVIGEDNGEVVALSAGIIALTRDEVNI